MTRHTMIYVILFSIAGCQSPDNTFSTVKIVDDENAPIEGVEEFLRYPLQKKSNRAGELKVRGNFPVLWKEGYSPVIARVKRSGETTVIMSESTEPVNFERESAKSLQNKSSKLEARN